MLISRVKDASTYEKGLIVIKKLILLGIPLAAVMGCSSMSLQCGMDGDSSYLTLEASKEMLPQYARLLDELCSPKPS